MKQWPLLQKNRKRPPVECTSGGHHGDGQPKPSAHLLQGKE